MSEKDERVSLASQIKAKPKHLAKSEIKDKMKTASFSQPLNRLAEASKLKNKLELMKYAWPTEKKVKSAKSVVSIGKISIEPNSDNPKQKPTKKTTATTLQQAPQEEEKQDIKVSDFTAWLNTSTISLTSKELPMATKKKSKKAKSKSESKKSESKKKKEKDKSATKSKEKKKSPKQQSKGKDKKKTKKSKAKSDLKHKIASSVKKKDEIATETLAELYVEQGYYKKAINTYKQLSLINPEKSSFFAPLIKDLKNKLK